jgi:hypothetical protein
LGHRWSDCETINSDAYIKTLQKLKQRYWWVQPNWNPGDMLIQHNNAHPHASLWTQEAIAKFGWTVVLIWRYQIFTFLGHRRMQCVGQGLKMTREWFVQWGHGYVNRKRAGTGQWRTEEEGVGGFKPPRNSKA